MPRLRESIAATGPFQFFIVVLSFFALGMLAIESVATLEPETRTILAYVDPLVCGLFLFDFAVSLARAEDRWAYFKAWGWIDLVSSIPMIDQLRWTRAARILRFIRVLRSVRASKILASFFLQRRAQSAFLGVALISALGAGWSGSSAVAAKAVLALGSPTASQTNARLLDDREPSTQARHRVPIEQALDRIPKSCPSLVM